MTDLAARAKPIVDEAIGSLCTAAVVRVERRGSVDTYAAGTLCPDPSAGPDGACTATSLFDLASLTKLATTALVLSFVRERQLQLDMPFRELGHAKSRMPAPMANTPGTTAGREPDGLRSPRSTSAAAVRLGSRES